MASTAFQAKICILPQSEVRFLVTISQHDLTQLIFHYCDLQSIMEQLSGMTTSTGMGVHFKNKSSIGSQVELSIVRSKLQLCFVWGNLITGSQHSHRKEVLRHCCYISRNIVATS